MSISIGELILQNPLINAAYIKSKTIEDLDLLSKSSCGAVVVGSITVMSRPMNNSVGYWQHKSGLYSLNSYGMPNGGLAYYQKSLPKIVKTAHNRNKPVIVNIAGFSNTDFTELIALAERSGADYVEINLGCPNVWTKGEQKQIISYHPILIKDILDNIAKQRFSINLSVKLSPLPPDILREVAKVITDSKIITAVVATNSYPNALVSTGAMVGDEKDLAGMTGKALKPISLGVVKQLYDLLPGSIDIIGCGGIYSKIDVNDYLDAGAKAVQVGTALIDIGLSIFDELIETS